MDDSHILIVEDDVDLSEMLCNYLETRNYHVFAAFTGEEAFQISDEHSLDLIILDIRLPDIDGFSICRHLRSQPHTKDIPIIFLTEKRDRVDKLQGLELGVVDYVTKPFDIQELQLRIRNSITRSQQAASLHSVTELPEGSIVTKQLDQLINEAKPWYIMKFSIESLEEFQEKHGFVAASDILRSIALIITNAVQEYGSGEDFIGHLSNDKFIIITDETHIEKIYQRIDSRTSKSQKYLYSSRGNEAETDETDFIPLRFTHLIINSSDQSFSSVDELKAFLNQPS